MIHIRKIQIPAFPTQAPRRLYVRVPRDYARSDRRYPVLYMFDGHNVFYDSHATFGKSWGMKAFLDAAGLPLIVAAVECNPEGCRRLNEYAPWDFRVPKAYRFNSVPAFIQGEGERTMDWFIHSLKPEIDRRYRTLPDREHTLIAGSSMGGLMALYAVTAHNEVFSRAAALSPSLWAGGGNLRDLLNRPLSGPTRVYLDVGDQELPAKRRAALAALFEAAAALTRSGADAAARVVPGGRHNEASWEARIPVFLDYLL